MGRKNKKTLGDIFGKSNIRGGFSTDTVYLENGKCAFNKFDGEVVVEEEPLKVILQLMEEIKIEWMMYLWGHTDKEGEVEHITHWMFPPQEATSAHVKAIKDNQDYSYVDDIRKEFNPDVIYTIHSHNTMGAFASGEDEDNILVAGDGGFIISKRTKAYEIKFYKKIILPCKSFSLLDATDKVKYADINMDEVTYEQENKKGEIVFNMSYKFCNLIEKGVNIKLLKEPKPAISNYSTYQYGLGYQWGGNYSRWGQKTKENKKPEIKETTEEPIMKIPENDGAHILYGEEEDDENWSYDDGYDSAQEWLDSGADRDKIPDFVKHPISQAEKAFAKGFRRGIKDYEDTLNIIIPINWED